ncbi:hypothetical protein GcC1_218019 [Golovinomyces cichoracearum]|uniref:Uncharacterized protein n=1 Tax=Golovinomyces cichoracearum TaxID=62708 RepID=A0A420H8J1_9PEZI|nr:hypothetical protein GcC1_218019 [Golovinomyces cichoracearum]
MYKTTSTAPVSPRPPYYHSGPAPLTPAQSITQTYSLAHIARRKLAREASRSDLHLGRLVGHANLLDSLMLELGRAEREQQQWLLTQSRKMQRHEGARHIQWADCVVEEEATDDWHASDADSDLESEYDDERLEMGEDEDEDMETDMEVDMVSVQRVSSYRILPAVTTLTRPSTPNPSHEIDHVEILQLEYSPSHSSPPELDHDSDSSEDEAMPPSPPADRVSSFFRDDSPTIVDPLQDHLSNDLSSQDPSITAKNYFHSQSKNDHLISTDIYSV